MKFRAVWHYCKDDPDCGGDYSGIDLFDGGSKKIASWGDHYHDKGADRLEGFVEGVEYVTGSEPVIEHEHVADAED